MFSIKLPKFVKHWAYFKENIESPVTQGHLSSSPLDRTQEDGEKYLTFENHGDDT